MKYLSYLHTFVTSILLLLIIIVFQEQLSSVMFFLAIFLVALVTYVKGRIDGALVFVTVGLGLFFVIDWYKWAVYDFWSRYIAFIVLSIVSIIAQSAISESKSRILAEKNKLQTLSDSITDSIITINEKSVIIFVNPAACETFGWEEKDLLEHSLTIIMPERFRQGHLKGFQRYLDSGIKKLNWKSVEIVGLKKDGTEFPIEISFGEFAEKNRKYFSAVVRDISERNKFADAIKKSEDRYKAFVANSTEGIWRFEFEKEISIELPIDEQIEKIFQLGFVAECNDAMAKLYGYKESTDLIGKKVHEIMNKTTENITYLKTALENNYKIENFESFVVTSKGETRYFISSLIGIVDDGCLVRGWGMQRDITIKKSQDRELEKNRERYLAFIKNSEEAIWLIEYKNPIDMHLPKEEQIEKFYSEGIIVEANQKFADLYGVELEKTIGTKVIDLTPPTEQGKQFLDVFIDAGYNIQDWGSESTVDGKTRYGSTSFKGILESNKVVRAWVVQRETTDIVLQKRVLLNSEERYKAFIENNENAIWRIEFNPKISTSDSIQAQTDKFFLDGYIAEANEATARILNVDFKSSLINKPLHTVAKRTDSDDKFVKYFIESNYIAQNFESTDTIDNKIVYYSSSMTGILENDKWVRAWVVRRDVTQQKELLIEKERLLKETQEAKISLELASVEKDRFLANLSHELRTPLVSVVGYSTLLKGSTDIEEIGKGIEVINRNALLQLELIEDLLDISRIVAGKIELHKETFELCESIQQSIDMLKPRILEKDIEIKFSCPPMDVIADKKRIGQVFSNILGNAIKFTEKGVINVNCGVTDTAFWFSVKDSGMGIAPENVSKLFKQFFQIDSTSTKRKQGLGLGLSIVKNLVALHEGKVDVLSTIGEGSEFIVTIPNIGEESIVQELNDSFAGLRLLLIEDDIDTGNLLKVYLKKKGAEVEVRTSVKDAFTLLETEKFDLYLCDIAMPEEDGLSLIKKLRKRGDVTPAVALTAYVDYKELAIRSGFDFFMSKPVKFEEFAIVRLMVK